MSSNLKQPVVQRRSEGLAEATISDAEFRKFQALIHKETGIFLSEGKRELLVSRLGKRLRHFGVTTFDEYFAIVVHGDPTGNERRELINCITTNKTDFFREPHHFEFLESKIFADCEQRRKQPIHIWCAASSTGEEPYTLAITAAKHFGPRASECVKIVASDIDTQVLEKAKKGVYEIDRLSGLAKEKWHPYFLKGTGQASGLVRVKPEVQRLVSFQQINLIESRWPWTQKFDVIFCRNVIIYFDRPTQESLFRHFAQCLEPNGYLILGHSENMHGCDDLFRSVGMTVYQMTNGGGSVASALPSSAAPPAPAPAAPVARRVALPSAARTATPPAPQSSAPAPAPAARPSAAPFDASIIVGGVFASKEPKVVRTLLGSCVAACLYDPVAQVGGMNHFMLPDGESQPGADSARFGVHAMEVLVNEIMKLGGDRRRLQAKVFGGADVVDSLRSSSGVGQRNSEFVRTFLRTEGITLVGERLGGRSPLEVRFHTGTGKALVREAGLESMREARAQEEKYKQSIKKPVPKPEDDVTLF